MKKDMMAEVEGKLVAAGYNAELTGDAEHGLLGDRHHVSDRTGRSRSTGIWQATSNFKRRSS